VKNKTKSDIHIKYHNKEVAGSESTMKRLQETRLGELDSEIKHLEDKKNLELEVFG